MRARSRGPEISRLAIILFLPALPLERDQPLLPFAGTPGKANCHGQSVSALAHQFGGLDSAAAALGFFSVSTLQEAITAFGGG
jgi:hypothetical protein